MPEREKIVYYMYLFCGERTYMSGADVEMREQFGGSVLFPPCEAREQAPLPTRPSHWSKKGFFKKKNSLYFKKDKEKTNQNPSGGPLTRAVCSSAVTVACVLQWGPLLCLPPWCVRWPLGLPFPGRDPGCRSPRLCALFYSPWQVKEDERAKLLSQPWLLGLAKQTWQSLNLLSSELHCV